MRRIRVSALVAALFLAVASGHGETVFRIAVQLDDGEEVLGLGVLVASEQVLTADGLVSEGSQVLVRRDSSGARTVADVTAAEPEAGLALLAVPGLAGDPATVAKEGPGPGRFVYLQSIEGAQRQGAFLSAYKDENEWNRYRFTARAEENETGAPLMNNCDQLLAVSRAVNPTQPGGGESAGGVSGAFPDLMAFLLENGVDVRVAAMACPSLQDQRSEAIQTGRRLEEEKAALTEEIEQLEVSIAEGRQRTEEEIAELESRRRELSDALERKDADLAAKQAEAERMARLQSDLEERIRQNEEALRTREQELSDARQREESAQERASFLERLLIFALLGVSVVLILIALTALRKHRKEQSPVGEPAEFAGNGRERPGPVPPPATGPEGGDAGPTQPATPRERARDSSTGEPRTVIAGGPWAPPAVDQSPRQPAEPAGPAEGPRPVSDDPVVGWLVVVDGPGIGAEIVLGNGQNALGRGEDARARIDFGDPEISRAAHAIVAYDWKSNRFYLQQGTGTNLTYMNGQQLLEPVELVPGSEFTVGNTTLRFVPFCDESFTWAKSSGK